MALHSERLVLRHGWGGDLEKRDRVLAERHALRDEVDSHPHKDRKFGDAPPSHWEHKLLREMYQRGS